MPRKNDAGALYAISDLKQVYGARTVLDIPYLEIEEGRIHALLGPNGAGKSTFLNILGFLDAPTQGVVLFRGEPASFSESELGALRKRVVVVDQQPILFTTSVYKNLEFGLKIRKVPKEKRTRIIEEALELVGMSAFAQARAHRLSGGETQRVALARALAVRPSVLLCDEPTASVDVENQEAILHILKQINDQHHISILFTSHNRSHVARLAHNTLFLENGKLVDSVRENLFSATIGANRGRLARCAIQGVADLHLPGDRTGGKTGVVKVLIDPAKITFGESNQDGESLNLLEGRVTRVGEENGSIRITVDVGVRLDIHASRRTYKENPPLVGEPLPITIPPEAIRIL